MEIPKYLSIGRSCSRLQLTPDKLRLLASRLGIQPAYFQDDVEYYHEASIDYVQEHIWREERREQHNKWREESST